MNIKSKLTAALATLALAGALAVPTSSAQAGGHGWGIGAGIVGGAILGTAIANSAAYNGVYYVDGYPRCRWERRFNAFGDYVGAVKVCRY